MYPETQYEGTIFPSSSSASSPAQLLGSASMLGRAFAGDVQQAKRCCALTSLWKTPLAQRFHSVALKEPFIPLSPPHPLLKVSFRRPCKVFTIQKGNCLGKLESFIVLCDNHEAVREQSQCLTKQ